jgi:uncharacterized membrane protein YqaE (UPF0057 family)
MEELSVCHYCGKSILLSDYFCPNCGKRLKDKPLSTSILRQIFVYLLSFFLPPLGLWPAVKYLKQADDKSRMIGFIAVTLTIISASISIWLSMGIVSEFNKQLNNSLKLYL